MWRDFASGPNKKFDFLLMALPTKPEKFLKIGDHRFPGVYNSFL